MLLGVGHVLDRFAGEAFAIDVDAAFVADKEDAVFEFRVAVLGVVEVVDGDLGAVGVVRA